MDQEYYSVKVGVRTLGHVIVEHQIHSFEINSSALEISYDHDSLFTFFEDLILLDSKFHEYTKTKFLPFFLR